MTSFFPSSDQVGGNATLCNRACERLKRNSEIAFRMIKFEVSLGYPKKVLSGNVIGEAQEKGLA